MLRNTSTGVFMLVFCTAVFGQNASNPFEIWQRLPKAAALANANVPLPANLFDMMPHRVPNETPSLTENTTEAFQPFSVLPRGGGLSGGVMTALLLAAFAFLTFSVAANRSAVGKAWAGFLNDAGFAVAHREASGFVGNAPYYLLYVNFLFNAGIFLFLVTRVFNGDKFNNIWFLLICMGVAAGVFLSKHLMLGVVRSLFPVGAEVRKYNFLIAIFNCVLGLFLVPFNLLIAFSTTVSNEQLLLVSWMLGLVAIFYAYRSLRAGTIGLKFLTQNPLHFLLYLCAVEIVPVLLLVKLALMQSS